MNLKHALSCIGLFHRRQARELADALQEQDRSGRKGPVKLQAYVQLREEMRASGALIPTPSSGRKSDFLARVAASDPPETQRLALGAFARAGIALAALTIAVVGLAFATGTTSAFRDIRDFIEDLPFIEQLASPKSREQDTGGQSDSPLSPHLTDSMSKDAAADTTQIAVDSATGQSEPQSSSSGATATDTSPDADYSAIPSGSRTSIGQAPTVNASPAAVDPPVTYGAGPEQPDPSSAAPPEGQGGKEPPPGEAANPPPVEAPLPGSEPPGQSQDGPPGHGPDGNGPPGQSPDGPPGNGPDGNGPPGQDKDKDAPPANGPDGNGPPGQDKDKDEKDKEPPPGNGPSGDGPPGQTKDKGK